MRRLLVLILAFSSISLVQAQDKDLIKEAANEMAWSLYSKNGDQQLLADQVERQIKEQIAANPEMSEEDIIEKMIKEQQEENIEYAYKANDSWSELRYCEDALGEEETKESGYVSKYAKEKVDPIQDSLKGKVKQFTVETYIQATLISKQIEYTFKANDCSKKLKELVRKAKSEKSCEDKSSQGYPYNPKNVGISLGQPAGAIGY